MARGSFRYLFDNRSTLNHLDIERTDDGGGWSLRREGCQEVALRTPSPDHLDGRALSRAGPERDGVADGRPVSAASCVE